MEKPVLVIMAAGIGSRYGGLKQIDPIDEQGCLIIDYSIYDAIKAGFNKLVFIIKKKDEADFRAMIGNRMEKQIETVYAYQEVDKLPQGYQVPAGRTKPFGTAHAVLCCEDLVDGPFAVINADDYYGRDAYKLIYEYLANHPDDEKYRYAMVGYELQNTLTEHGHVARGVCKTDCSGYLTAIHERTHIEKRGENAVYTEDDGISFVDIPADSTVSMNLWGFSKSIMPELKARFPRFLDENKESNPLECEYFLPTAVNDLINDHKAVVQVLTSSDKWYGVTYKADKEVVVAAIAAMKERGFYPKELWRDVRLLQGHS